MGNYYQYAEELYSEISDLFFVSSSEVLGGKLSP